MKTKINFNYKYIILFAYTLLAILLLFREVATKQLNQTMFELILFLLMSWFIVFIDKVFKLKLADIIYYGYYILIFLSIFLGEILNLNFYLDFFNSFVYILIGAFLFILGIYIIYRIDNLGFIKFSLLYTFSLFFAGFASLLLMISDYLVLFRILNLIEAHNLDTLIIDAIYSLVGTILISIYLIFDYVSYKKKSLERLLSYF